MTYNYSFVAWPSETWGFDPAIFRLFELLQTRVEHTAITSEEFEQFRSRLNHVGITLREIERVPYYESEKITN
jgi:hypothetical protein